MNKALSHQHGVQLKGGSVFPTLLLDFALHSSHSWCAESPLELAKSTGVRNESAQFIRQLAGCTYQALRFYIFITDGY